MGCFLGSTLNGLGTRPVNYPFDRRTTGNKNPNLGLCIDYLGFNQGFFMAYSRAVSRFCFRLQSISTKFNTKTPFPLCTDSSSFIKSTSKPHLSSSSRCTSRLPLELSALITMMPLHSAIASACLKSGLLIESHSWGLVPQGISMPL
ncbi:hypothetical protein R6Q59_013332 [Mikania micrantha]